MRVTLCANPAAAEPATNKTIASCVSNVLLNRSESLSQIGVLIVIVSRLAVDHPGVLTLRAVQVGHDRGQGRRDNRGRDHRGEQRCEQTGHHTENFAVREFARLRRLDECRRGHP